MRVDGLSCRAGEFLELDGGTVGLRCLHEGDPPVEPAKL